MTTSGKSEKPKQKTSWFKFIDNMYGCLSDDPIKRGKQYEFVMQFRSLPFDNSSTEKSGEIKADPEKKGTLIGSNDLLIASISPTSNVILVTRNTQECSRIERHNLMTGNVKMRVADKSYDKKIAGGKT